VTVASIVPISIYFNHWTVNKVTTPASSILSLISDPPFHSNPHSDIPIFNQIPSQVRSQRSQIKIAVLISILVIKPQAILVQHFVSVFVSCQSAYISSYLSALIHIPRVSFRSYMASINIWYSDHKGQAEPTYTTLIPDPDSIIYGHPQQNDVPDVDLLRSYDYRSIYTWCIRQSQSLEGTSMAKPTNISFHKSFYFISSLECLQRSRLL
jgi:hypothetical protein